MNVFAQITKVDEARREVWGRACQEVPDHSGEIFDYEKSKPHFEQWSSEVQKDSGGKSLGNIRSMHGNVAAGKVISLTFNDSEHAIDIGTKIIDENEWQKVLEGVHTGFSIGGRYVDKVKEGDLTRYVAAPSEISLVDRPCIPTATFFDVIKADGSVARAPFKSETKPMSKLTAAELAAKTVQDLMDKGVIEPERLIKLTQDEVALMQKNGMAKGVVVPDIKADGDGAKAADGGAKDGIAKSDAPAPMTAEEITALVTKSVAEALANAKVDPGVAASQDNGTRGGEGAAANKADAAAGTNLGEGAGNASGDASKVAARDDVSPKEGKDKYGDVEFADEKNKKYPIDTEAHIRAAWSYINKPKNAAKYSKKDLETIKNRIIAAWKKKIDKAGPPSASEKMNDAEFTKRAEFIKGMYTVADLAVLLQAISYMRDGCASEAAWEGDNSDLPTKLQDWLKAGVEILTEMVDEETGEMIATGNAVTGPLMMADAGDLSKVGARHSKTDMERVQKMHDTAVELGADCSKAAGDTDGGDDGDAAAKHDHGNLTKFDQVARQIESTTSLMEKVVKENADLKKVIAEQNDRISKLEKQPAGIKGSLRVVGKSDDINQNTDAGAPAAIKSTPGQHNPDAAQALIKSQIVSNRGGMQ